MNVDNVRSQMRKGMLEYCILLLLHKEPSYASDIIQKLKEARLIVVEGTLYPLLTRLKNDDLLSYEWVESTQGPPRKYYSLTPQGETFLSGLEAAWEELANTVNHLKKQLKTGYNEKDFNHKFRRYRLSYRRRRLPLLDNYLTNLRIHFCREEGAEEIVHDIELRISELFTDRLNEGKQVITIEDVEEIIARMGKPEDLSDEESGEASGSEKQKGTTMRRLFRDPDNKVLGGVASGLAAYMGWDVTWVRIILLVLGFFVHGVILAYIIAWIIIPMARTAPEKLAMKGAAINMENIGKTVTDGFEKVNDYVRSDRPRSILQKIGEGIVSVAGFLIKFLLVFIAICCAPVLFVLLIVFFALLMAATGLIAALPAVLYEVLPAVNWATVGSSPGLTVAMSVAGILVIGIPIIGLIHMLMRYFGGWQPMSIVTKIIFIVLWLIALGVGVFFVLNDPNIASMISYSL